MPLWLAGWASLGLASYAAPAAAQTAPPAHPFQLTIAPGKVGEICMYLSAGDTLTWSFQSSVDTDFNLHHHEGAEVSMPIQRAAIRSDTGQHTAERSNDWCLMWTAPAGQQLLVRGRWSAKRLGAAAKPASS